MSLALNPTLTGAAGEHYVLFELLRRGYVAGLAPTGNPDIDIIVCNKAGADFASVQVKTRLGAKEGGWPLRAKHEKIVDKKLFYAFVDFRARIEGASPEIFIIPSGIVAKIIREEHKQYISKPGKKGQQLKSSGLRNLWPSYKHWKECPADWMEKYRGAWSLLGLEPLDPNAPISNIDKQEELSMAAS